MAPASKGALLIKTYITIIILLLLYMKYVILNIKFNFPDVNKPHSIFLKIQKYWSQ